MNIKEIPLPEPFGLFCGVRHDPPKAKEFWGVLNEGADNGSKCNLYTADQLRARDLQVWNLALDEAAKVCRELDNAENGELYRAAARFCAVRIEALKEQE